MRAPAKRQGTHLAGWQARLCLAFVACAIVGVAPGSAGAVNVFTLDSSPDGRAGVAVDSAGTGYFAWEHKETSTNDVTQFCKVARGGKCTNPIVLATPPLNPAPFNSTDVSAAFPVLGAGSTVYVVGPRFVAGDVVVWTSTDGGNSFGPAVQVTQSGAYQGTDPTECAADSAPASSSHPTTPGLNFTSVQAGSKTAHGADLTPPGGLTNISGSTLGLAGGGASGIPSRRSRMAQRRPADDDRVPQLQRHRRSQRRRELERRDPGDQRHPAEPGGRPEGAVPGLPGRRQRDLHAGQRAQVRCRAPGSARR